MPYMRSKRLAAVLLIDPDGSPGCDFSGVLDHFLRGLDSRDFTQVTVHIYARGGKKDEQ